jgi:hypothetical protein
MLAVHVSNALHQAKDKGRKSRAMRSVLQQQPAIAWLHAEGWRLERWKADRNPGVHGVERTE